MVRWKRGWLNITVKCRSVFQSLAQRPCCVNGHVSRHAHLVSQPPEPFSRPFRRLHRHPKYYRRQRSTKGLIEAAWKRVCIDHSQRCVVLDAPAHRLRFCSCDEGKRLEAGGACATTSSHHHNKPAGGGLHTSGTASHGPRSTLLANAATAVRSPLATHPPN